MDEDAAGHPPSSPLLRRVEELRGMPPSREAQREVYLYLRDKLLGRIRASLPYRVQSRIDEEDVLHEALLRALRALDGVEFHSENAFVAWVYRIARNLVHDQIKRRSAAALAFDGDADGDAIRSSRVPAGETNVAGRLERNDWIEAALELLTDREAEVIRLHSLEGRSFEEIGVAWGKKASTIKRLHALALEHLRGADPG